MQTKQSERPPDPGPGPDETNEVQASRNTSRNESEHTEQVQAREARPRDTAAPDITERPTTMVLPLPITVLEPPTASFRDRVGTRVNQMPALPRGTPIIKLQVAPGTSTEEVIWLADAFSAWCPGAAGVVPAKE